MRRLAVVVAAAVLVAACGDDDGGADTDQAPAVDAETAVDDPVFVAAADQLVEDYAEARDVPAVAFVWGLELGYDLDQLLDAATAGTLANNGSVVAASSGLRAGDRSIRMIAPGLPVEGGEIVEPAGARRGAIALWNELAGFRRAAEGLTSVYTFLELLQPRVATVNPVSDADRPQWQVLIAIMELTAAGYGLEQIVEALVLGTAGLARVVVDGRRCYGLRDNATAALIAPTLTIYGEAGCGLDLQVKASIEEDAREDEADPDLAGGEISDEPDPVSADGEDGEGIQDGRYVGTIAVSFSGEGAAELERIYASAETTNDVQLQVDDGRITEFRALLGIEGEVQFGEETCVDTAIFTFSSNPSTASYTATTATVDTTFESDATSSCGDVAQQPAETKPLVLTFTGSTVTGEFGPLEDGGATASFAFTIARS